MNEAFQVLERDQIIIRELSFFLKIGNLQAWVILGKLQRQPSQLTNLPQSFHLHISSNYFLLRRCSHQRKHQHSQDGKQKRSTHGGSSKATQKGSLALAYCPRWERGWQVPSGIRCATKVI